MKLDLKPAATVALFALGAAAPSFAQGTDYLRAAEEAAARGDRLTATQLYQSAMIAAPKTTEPYLRLAAFYAGDQQWVLARKYYAIALELEPANPPALAGLAFAALARGDVAAAQYSYDILMETCAPGCAEANDIGNAIAAHGPPTTTSE